MASMYDDDGDLAHYYRFQQIKYGRAYLHGDDAGEPSGAPVGVDYDAVYPMLANPRSDDYADPELRAVSDAANRAWSRLLATSRPASTAAGGAAPRRAQHVQAPRRDARAAGQPTPAAPPIRDARHAGPTFEWVAAR